MSDRPRTSHTAAKGLWGFVGGILIGAAAGMIGVGGGEFRIPVFLHVLSCPSNDSNGEGMYEDLIADEPAGQRKTRRWLYILLGIAVLYVLGAYIIAPMAWKNYAHYRPSFDDHPRITQMSDGHPGDPLNVSLIGTRAQIDAIMQAAKWYPAAALGLKSDLRIAADTILSRPDDEAPVSNLFLFGRKEDLAFEQPVGNNPRKRHHVRFWNTGKYDDAAGRPIWVGSASYDERVGLSHTTGQITHHIAPDVDAERDHLFENLKATGELSEDFSVENFHKQLEGRNGGGDRWFTDGKLSVGIIAERNQ